jgi:nitroreductase
MTALSGFELLRHAICTRRNVSARRLHEPGPGPEEVEALMGLAAAAPDHGMLGPWRFIFVEWQQRRDLGDAFAQALKDRDPMASEEQLAQAREKCFHAPTLLVAVVDLGGPADAGIPPLEPLVSLGSAIQNVLLGAQAMGYGAGLTSGHAMRSLRLRTLCRLQPQEHAVCCINIGTVGAEGIRPRQSDRRSPAALMSVLHA